MGRVVHKEKDVTGHTETELRNAIITCDGVGETTKDRCLEELLRREFAEGYSRKVGV